MRKRDSQREREVLLTIKEWLEGRKSKRKRERKGREMEGEEEGLKSLSPSPILSPVDKFLMNYDLGSRVWTQARTTPFGRLHTASWRVAHCLPASKLGMRICVSDSPEAMLFVTL